MFERRRRPRSARPAVLHGQRIDLVYRRVLINDIVAREAECRALLDAYEARAVCVANTLRCKIPHKKAFFAVLTDERYAHLFTPRSARSSGDTSRGRAIVEDGPVVRDGKTIDLLAHLRAHREPVRASSRTTSTAAPA